MCTSTPIGLPPAPHAQGWTAGVPPARFTRPALNAPPRTLLAQWGAPCWRKPAHNLNISQREQAMSTSLALAPIGATTPRAAATGAGGLPRGRPRAGRDPAADDAAVVYAELVSKFPALMTIKRFVQETGISRSKAFVLMGTGILATRKLDTRTYILGASAARLLSTLPVADTAARLAA
jgi:hypothetical protein